MVKVIDLQSRATEIKIKKLIREKRKKFENDTIRITNQETKSNKIDFNRIIKKLIKEKKIEMIEKDIYKII